MPAEVATGGVGDEAEFVDDSLEHDASSKVKAMVARLREFVIGKLCHRWRAGDVVYTCECLLTSAGHRNRSSACALRWRATIRTCVRDASA